MDVFGTSISAVGSGVLVNIVRKELPPFYVLNIGSSVTPSQNYFPKTVFPKYILKHSFIVRSASLVKHKCNNSYDNKNNDYNYSDSTLIATLCICSFNNVIRSTTVRSTIIIALAFSCCTFCCCRFWGSSENKIL